MTTFMAVCKIVAGCVILYLLWRRNEILSTRQPTHPLSDKLNDPERMYKHVAFGLMLVSGSDLNWVDSQVKDAESGISREDKLLLRANWKLVKARLESEGYV